MTGALRVVEHHLMVYRRTWKGGMFVSFASPILFLAAIGIGLGSLIARGPVHTVGGVSYLTFLAPGLLAATAMQTAFVETTYPVKIGRAHVELQSQSNLVCRLLLEKKKKTR